MTTSTKFAASLLLNALWAAHGTDDSSAQTVLDDIVQEIWPNGVLSPEVEDEVRDVIGLMVEDDDDLWVITTLEEYPGVKIPGEWYK
jgi:hypothetical protein